MSDFKMAKITGTTEAIEILTKEFKPDRPTFADIETENLYYGWRLLQVYQPETVDVVYYIDMDYVDHKAIKKALKPLHTVWYGANYDFGTMEMTTDKFDDLMLATRTAYPQLPAFDLSTATRTLITEDLYKGLDKKELQKQGFPLGVTLTEEQIRYACADVVALSILWQNTKIQEAMTRVFYKVDMHALRHTIEFQKNGAIVHVPSVLKELDIVEKKLIEELEVLGGINSNSYKQVRACLSELLGKEVTESDGAYLVRLIAKHKGTKVAEIAEAIYNNRRSKLRKTNLTKLNKPKVFTKFNPYGTGTGRYSSEGKFGKDAKKNPEGINFQNITRNLQYVLQQDTEDTVVVHADYSTAELRAACSIMGDYQMRDYLLKGIDLHRVSAQMADPSILIDTVTKEQRQKGKAISFGFIFGMGAEKFQQYAYDTYEVSFTLEEAKEVRTKYLLTYKEIAEYQKRWWNDYKTIPVSTPMGRQAMARTGTDAINYATQGSVGELAKLAIHYLCREFPEATKYLFSQVHDAIYLRVPKEDALLWGYRLATAMLTAWTEILRLPMFIFKDIPMGVELEVGTKRVPVEVFSLEELDVWYKGVKDE